MTTHWYQQKAVLDELVLFGRAIQGISPYQVVIEPDQTKCHTGRCSFDDRTISVNPILFNEPDAGQYHLTKALLVHEAGHRRHTTPAALPVIVREIANILEDERVESLMWEEFVGLRWLITKLATEFYRVATPIDEASEKTSLVVSYFLQLRWARRVGQPVKGGLCRSNQLLWQTIEPLVHESWQAKDSMIVNRNAMTIAETLGFINTNSKQQEVT